VLFFDALGIPIVPQIFLTALSKSVASEVINAPIRYEKVKLGLVVKSS